MAGRGAGIEATTRGGLWAYNALVQNTAMRRAEAACVRGGWASTSSCGVGGGIGGGGARGKGSVAAGEAASAEGVDEADGGPSFGRNIRSLFRRSGFPSPSGRANEAVRHIRKDALGGLPAAAGAAAGVPELATAPTARGLKKKQYEQDMVYSHPQPMEGEEYFLQIRAFHLGRRIDFRRMAERYRSLPHALQRDSLILDLTNRDTLVPKAAGAVRGGERSSALPLEDAAMASPSSSSNDGGGSSGEADDGTIVVNMKSAHHTRPSYAVVYRYGSIVFFNVSDAARKEFLSEGATRAAAVTRGAQHGVLSKAINQRQKLENVRGNMANASFQDECIQATKEFCSGVKFPHCAEEYGVAVESQIDEDKWSEISGDYVAVKRFDLNSVRVIGSVLGQSVALDHYANDVDTMLHIFTQLNEDMERTGNFSMKKERLFQLVATNNTTLTDLVNNLKLLDRSDTAWNYERYSDLWEDLRKEFELEDRFETLEYKLNLVQHNVKFFLEILQNRKSDTLEWIIIILISGEILVSLWDIGTRLPGT